MKSNSGYEPASFSIAPSTSRISSVVILSSLLLAFCPLPLLAGSSITDIARLSDFDRMERPAILGFIEGCSSLGLPREAAEFLEKRVQLGQITREDSAPLFEGILA